MRVFHAQVQLAMKLSLPLVLYLREAEEDGLALLREVGAAGGLACSTGDEKLFVTDFPVQGTVRQLLPG